MKRFVLMMGLMTLAAGVGFAGEWTGFVSDAKCAKADAGHAGCAKSCISNGQEAVLVDADGNVHKIANQDKIKEHAGQKVKVTGSEADGKISVDTVTAAD